MFNAEYMLCFRWTAWYIWELWSIPALGSNNFLWAKLFEEMLEMCEMIDDPECPKSGKHHEVDASQIKKSECAVKKVMEAISHFTNLWKIPNKKRLYCLSSGAPIPQEIEVDILRADELGKTLKSTFIQEQLIHGHKKDFFDPVACQKLKTMDNANKTVCLRTSQGSLIQYKEQCDLTFKLLVKSQMLNVPIDLDTLMT